MKRSGVPSHKLNELCKVAITSLASFFLSWDRKCSIFAGFSPVSDWEVLIKEDASTGFGSGGVCFPSLVCHNHKWSSEERACALALSVDAIRVSTTFFEFNDLTWATASCIAFFACLRGGEFFVQSKSTRPILSGKAVNIRGPPNEQYVYIDVPSP